MPKLCLTKDNFGHWSVHHPEGQEYRYLGFDPNREIHKFATRCWECGVPISIWRPEWAMHEGYYYFTRRCPKHRHSDGGWGARAARRRREKKEKATREARRRREETAKRRPQRRTHGRPAVTAHEARRRMLQARRVADAARKASVRPTPENLERERREMEMRLEKRLAQRIRRAFWQRFG